MCSSYGYRSSPYVLGLISIIEMILGVIRIIIFFGDKTSDPNNLFSYNSGNSSGIIPSPFLSSKQAVAAFIIDWIASIIPTFMGIYVALFSIVAGCTIFLTCFACVSNSEEFRRNPQACAFCFIIMCRMCKNKANHRCVSLNCNLPCYDSRPKLRFQVRLGVLGFFIFLRIIAIILYASDKNIRGFGGYMAAICSITIVCTVLMMALAFYQYRVWWYYRPDGAYKKCRCCCCKQHFHPSHQRFLPFPLVGMFRSEDEMGNRPCKNTVSGACPNLSLEHIAMFHTFDFKPHRRYQRAIDTTYVGFHRTDPAFAAIISKEGFRASMTPPQMLGFGVYFARSFAATYTKARHKGAFICAEVRMGNVRMVDKSELNEVCDTDSWWNEYDTIYYAHEEENRDEFCVKSPEQIVKWIMIMNDDRMHRYGLDRELD